MDFMNLEAKKWMNLVGILWIQLFTGTNFDFSAYSTALKQVLQISQVQLNNLAVASDLGKVFGWVSGFAMRRMPLWAVMLIATSMGLVGYGLQWLIITERLSSNYWQVGIVQVFSLHKKWKGFVQDEIDGHEKPIFKASSSICSANDSVKVSLIQSKAKKGWDYEIVGSFAERACTIYDDSHAIAAKVSMNNTVKDAIRSKDVYNVEVQAGIDQAFVFGMVAVLEKLSGEDGN